VEEIRVLDMKTAIEKLIKADEKWEDPLIHKTIEMIQANPEHWINTLFGAFLVSRKENQFLREAYLKSLQNSVVPVNLNK
jgi:hypothetical protein